MGISFSDTALTISEELEINSIVWIHSLPPGEMGPTRRILEDLEMLTGTGGFPVIERSVTNRGELIRVMNELSEHATRGLRPILHVDAHGSPKDGMLLAPSGDRVGWADIIELLRTLNVATQNNLVSVFALCFGLHIYKQVSLKRPVPSYLFFAPPSEITVGFLEAQTLAFYRHINHSSNVTQAFAQTLGGSMESFHCQGLFLQALVRYIRTHCRGKARERRQERMVTEILKRDEITHPTSGQLKQIRRDIREVLNPGQSLIDKFAPGFLIGRSAAFTYADIDRILQRTK